MCHLKKPTDFWTLLLAACLFALPSQAAIRSEECIECHDTYRGYLHGKAACTDCHSSVASLPHADRLPRPACVTCHRKIVTSAARDVHGNKGLDCKECHNVHFLNKEEKYCVSCHGSVAHTALPSQKKHLSRLACTSCHGSPEKTSMAVQVRIPDGRGVNASSIDRDGNHRVSKAEWHAFVDALRTEHKASHSISVLFKTEPDPHGIRSKAAPCATCHSPNGYFRSALLEVTGPVSFTLAVDPGIFVPELPSGEEFGRTVHGRNGVICSDCHKSQKSISEGWSENSTVCAVCHEKTQETYKASVHSKNGATHCVDCHNPHRIKSYRELSAEERVAICSRCHTDYLRKHRWLPNTVLHFSYLECTTCHSPRSEKSMVFYFARKTGGRRVPLSYAQLVKIYGSDPIDAIKAPVGGVSLDSRIGRLFYEMADRDKNLVVDASIVVTKVYHDYSETRLREKECVTCHSGEAGFYSSLFFALPGKAATAYLPVRGTIISAYPIGGFIDFFLLGENKIRKGDISLFLGRKTAGENRYLPALAFKLIDLFGLLLVAFILLGIFVHILLRIAVKP